jgi:adenosylcobyric acid synthase
MEDSQSLQNYQQRLGDVKIRIAVLAYRGLSNYNDLDVLMADPELYVELIHKYRPLDSFDMVLMIGSKTVIRDVRWLKDNGLFAEVQQFKGAVFGVCGGYQMLCRMLHDPDALEHDSPTEEAGLGLLDDDVIYQSPKILQRGVYELFSYPVQGYEIHCGRMANYPLFYQQGRIAGTHVHGVFDNNDFRTNYFKGIHADYQGYDYAAYRDEQIQGFADMVADNVDMDAIMGALR